MIRRYGTIAVLVVALLLTVGAAVNGAPDPSKPPTGSADGEIKSTLDTSPTPSAGDRNVVLEAFDVTDADTDGYPLDIEYICVQKTAESTLPDKYIFQLKLAIDTDTDEAYTAATDLVIGIIRRPNLGGEDGACFGVKGSVLSEVPNGEVAYFLILADLAFDAPDLLVTQLVVTVVASESLIGGADVSSGFAANSEFFLSIYPTIIYNATGDPDGQILVEPNDLEVAPEASEVVLGQFQIEDQGGDDAALLLQHLTLFLTGYRGDEVDNSVLDGIKSISIYKDTGATAPGFSKGDRRIWTLTKPALRGEFVSVDEIEKLELVAGYRGRTLMWIPNGAVERIYIVADLGTEFQNGDCIKLEIIAGARDLAEASSAFDLAPGETVAAPNLTYIVAPSPTLVIGSATVSSAGKLVVSMKNIPAPGLESLTATFVYDQAVADVAVDVLDNPKVRALGNYDVMAASPTANGLFVMVELKPGRKAATGDFDLLEIEFEAVGEAGEWTEIDVDPWATDADGNPIALDISSGKLEVRLIKGDVNFDGVVTRSDAREVARFIVGSSTLSWTKHRQLAADVAAPFCDPDFLADPATSAPACIDASDVRMIMLAAYGHIVLGAAVEPLQVNGIALSQNSNGFTLTVSGQGIAATQVQLFNLAGSLILAKEAQGNALQFQLNGPGGALANGVYLYVVTVKGYDGTVIKSEVRKLVILR